MKRGVVVAMVVACATLIANASCKSELERCLSKGLDDAATEQHCERAWQVDHDVRAAVAGARIALTMDDDLGLARWADRAPENVEGARIFDFRAQRLEELGDAKNAEALFRRALALRVDRDPVRATNTAVELLNLVKSYEPAQESVRLARIAWQQATLANHPLGFSLAAANVVDLLLDFGEIRTAELLLQSIDAKSSQMLRDIAEGRVEAARGRFALAASLFTQANNGTESNPGAAPTDGSIDLVEALLETGQVVLARRAVDRAVQLVAQYPTSSVDFECRLAATRARVEIAEGQLERARERVEHELGTACRDRARAVLLDAYGDVLAKTGRKLDAERAWRDAADSIEEWRISLPSARLRSGLIASHRRALEAWLDSAGARGDATAGAEVAQRMLGRALLDRMLDRETDSSKNPDALIGDVLERITDRHTLEMRVLSTHHLVDANIDLVAFLEGADAVWALRHATGTWTLRRVGSRTTMTALFDAARRNPDDTSTAAELGAALFPLETLPTHDAPLVVLLDHDLADLLLAGLRVDDHYLVEVAPIVEVPAPELLFRHPSVGSWQDAVVIGDPRGDLPGADREAVTVAATLHVRAAIGSDATRRSLLTSTRPRVLHIAAHSIVEQGRANFQLADGVVSSLELLGAGIAPRLAVVATCRSQAGDDPTTSLVAAFLAAGARGVIGAKRAIDDLQSKDLVRDFYDAGGERDPMHALATAQRRAIGKGRPAHEWAAISFFGNLEP